MEGRQLLGLDLVLSGHVNIRANSGVNHSVIKYGGHSGSVRTSHQTRGLQATSM